MRELSDAERIRRFMELLASRAREPARIFFTGGATAVLMGWRPTTIDVDIKMMPERDELLRAIQTIKEELRINVELASPADFIPLPAGWEERSPFIGSYSRLSFFHFDPYAQALAKIERRHAQDEADVQEMLARGLIERGKARAYFARIEPELYRFPAIDSASFRGAVQQVFGEWQ
jgi:hypothetical protein